MSDCANVRRYKWLALYALPIEIRTMYDLRIEIEPSNELQIGNCDGVAGLTIVLDRLQPWYSIEIEH